MNILNPMMCYNSLDILPYVVEYNKKEGVDLFIIDNYSNDGSWEYIQDNKIPSERIDTDGAFDLNMLLKKKSEIIHKIKPDWIILAGADDFIITPDKTMVNFIDGIDKLGFDVIDMHIIRFQNTGENRKYLDPRKECFYCVVQESIKSIHSYKNFTEYYGDTPIYNKEYMIAKVEDSLFLDYGNTRNKELREDMYQRRKTAWERGLPRCFGTHYELYSKRGWIWDKSELIDVRNTKYWQIINNKFN